MLSSFAVGALAACVQVLGLDAQETLKRECQTKADCTHPCRLTDCVENECLESPISGTPLFGEDDACTTSVCQNGELATTNKDAGTPCGNALSCDGAGTCVGCKSDGDCVGGPVAIIDERPAVCGVPACVDQVCGTKPAPEGRAPNDVPGDCAYANCDGVSVFASSTTLDPLDVPQPSDDPLDAQCVGYCDDMLGLVHPEMVPCGEDIGEPHFCCRGKCDLLDECVSSSAVAGGGDG